MCAELYLGIMSGTSLDGVDVALVDFSLSPPQLACADFTPMPEKLRLKITELIQTGQTSLQALGELDHQLGLLYADCVNRFLAKYQLNASQITAIGCHGQTVWHSPQGEYPFTTQLGDMHLVAAKTGITTIADFRRTDMAYGGQGAPLVPAFHQAMFYDPQWATVVLNIGGISNVSVLLPNQPVIGFDTGTGNTLLDQWIERHQGKSYDKNGEWASSGKVNEKLLAALLDEPFFQQPPPKSTGRELFNLAWLEQKIQQVSEVENSPKSTALAVQIPPQDVQATLAKFTAQAVAVALNNIQTTLPKRLLVCGGGAKNLAIMQHLTTLLPYWAISTTSEYGLDIDYVEAAAFAWLAYQRLHQQPSNMPSVTGAKRAVSLGAIFNPA